ncbi:MAG: response regulator transcription factor [Dehalococcoidia bacterium]|nr:response regulator transcription factor [Dehalococcoidia bacterium]
MQSLTLAIVDKNSFSRSGIRQMLAQQSRLPLNSIVETDPGEDGRDVVRLIEEASPEVVLLDIDYPSLSSLDLGRKITRHFPGTRLIILSSNPDENDEELFEVIRTGAVAYLMSRKCTSEELVDTIEKALAGKYPINDMVNTRPAVARRVLRQFQDMAAMGKPIEHVTAPLTAKEVQVLTLIAEGNSNKQIARLLGISEQTIKNHVSAILRKINANDRAHAVFIAVRDGLISSQPGREGQTN